MRPIASANCRTAGYPQGPQLGSREQIQELLRIRGNLMRICSLIAMLALVGQTNEAEASRVQQSPLRQFIRPRHPLSVLRSRASSSNGDLSRR